MLIMAALLPTNRPAPMIPPMEIITRWRARRDFESWEEAGKERSVAFTLLLDCGRWRKIRRNQTARHPQANCAERAPGPSQPRTRSQFLPAADCNRAFSDLRLSANVENRARGQ